MLVESKSIGRRLTAGYYQEYRTLRAKTFESPGSFFASGLQIVIPTTIYASACTPVCACVRVRVRVCVRVSVCV